MSALGPAVNYDVLRLEALREELELQKEAYSALLGDYRELERQRDEAWDRVQREIKKGDQDWVRQNVQRNEARKQVKQLLDQHHRVWDQNGVMQPDSLYREWIEKNDWLKEMIDEEGR